METAEKWLNEEYRGYTIVQVIENYEIRVMPNIGGGYGDYITDSTGKPGVFLNPDHAKSWLDTQIRNGRLHDLSLPRTRVDIKDGNLRMLVHTPGGDITVESRGDTAYPDASIFIGEHCVGFVEWHPDSKQFDFHFYGDSTDQPKATFKNITNR